MSEPSLPLTGGCNCGAVRFEINAPPVAAAYCHCTRCQRRTGAAALASAWVTPGSVTRHRGRGALRGWAPADGFDEGLLRECGSALFGRRPRTGTIAIVRFGAFDGDPGVRPPPPVRRLRRAVGADPRRRPPALRRAHARITAQLLLSQGPLAGGTVGSTDARHRRETDVRGAEPSPLEPGACARAPCTTACSRSSAPRATAPSPSSPARPPPSRTPRRCRGSRSRICGSRCATASLPGKTIKSAEGVKGDPESRKVTLDRRQRLARQARAHGRVLGPVHPAAAQAHVRARRRQGVGGARLVRGLARQHPARR